MTIPAASVADGVVDYAHGNNFTHIVVSTAQRPWWSELIRSSAAHEIIRRAGDISVHVVPEIAIAEGGAKRLWTWTPSHLLTRALDLGAYGGSAVMVGAGLMLGLFLQRYVGVQSIALVFLTAVLVSAVTYGLWPALFASVVSMLCFNFFFLPPL